MIEMEGPGQADFRLAVVGVTHHNHDGESRQALLSRVRTGTRVELRREPDNEYDAQAIAVHLPNGKQIGYLPAGDVRLASHLDRGGLVEAKVLRITGGPSIFDRIFGKAAKNYGCVLEIQKGDFDWAAVTPWIEMDRSILTLLRKAKEAEDKSLEKAVAMYRDVVEKIKQLDANGPTAIAWRSVRYPVNRLSMCLERLKMYSDAVEEIQQWKQYGVGRPIPDSEQDQVRKRLDRLQKKL